MGLTVIELELQSLLPLSKEKTQMSAVSNDESNEKQSERLQQLNNLASILPPGALTEGKLANGDACMRSNANIETNTEGKILDCVQLAHEIQSQANSAVDVLNDLLNYDKIENGTLCVEFAFAPVWNLIQRVLKEFTLPAVKKSLKLELMFEVVDKDGKFCAGSDIEQGKSIRSAQDLPAKAQDLVFYADIIRITQSIRNLMSNAIKFTSEGGSVRVRAVWMENSGATSGIKAAEVSPIGQNQKVYAKNKGSLLVNVEDSGVGMDPVQLAGLFRPGVQYDATNLQAGGGSGLGLYIAKGIVEEHKGTLVVTSGGLGQGTTFTISLPVFSVADLRQKCDKRKPTNASISDSIETSSSKLTLLKVLVVDDADSNRKLLSRLLRREGHTCDEADNGQLAVEMVADSMQEGEAPYDTILLDYEMPLMNGPETASEIRRKGWRVFIVGITGNTFTEDVEHFRSCGADAVLPKPVKLDDLRSIWQGHGLLRG